MKDIRGKCLLFSLHIEFNGQTDFRSVIRTPTQSNELLVDLRVRTPPVCRRGSMSGLLHYCRHSDSRPPPPPPVKTCDCGLSCTSQWEPRNKLMLTWIFYWVKLLSLQDYIQNIFTYSLDFRCLSVLKLDGVNKEKIMSWRVTRVREVTFLL